MLFRDAPNGKAGDEFLFELGVLSRIPWLSDARAFRARKFGRDLRLLSRGRPRSAVTPTYLLQCLRSEEGGPDDVWIIADVCSIEFLSRVRVHAMG